MATPTSSRRYSRFQPASASSHVHVASEDEPTVSASVGHDHWANDVLKAVDKAKAESIDGSAGSNSPESYCDSETGGRFVDSVGSSVEVVKAKILEKKRKFHTGRSLELKNLPDGCVEQVGIYLFFISFIMYRCDLGNVDQMFWRWLLKQSKSLLSIQCK